MPGRRLWPSGVKSLVLSASQLLWKCGSYDTVFYCWSQLSGYYSQLSFAEMLLSQLCIWKRRKGHVGPAWARVLRERKIALESGIKLTPELSRRNVRPRGRERKTLTHGVHSTPTLYPFLAEVVHGFTRLLLLCEGEWQVESPVLFRRTHQLCNTLFLSVQEAWFGVLNLPQEPA